MNTKTVLILGGAAVALYLLLRQQKKQVARPVATYQNQPDVWGTQFTVRDDPNQGQVYVSRSPGPELVPKQTATQKYATTPWTMFPN